MKREAGVGRGGEAKAYKTPAAPEPERGYGRQYILDLYAFIDWLMALPSELETRFHEEFTRFEAEKKMHYVTSAERIGMEKGIRQGMQQGMCQGLLEGLELGLELRFGAQGLRYLAEIRKIEREMSVKEKDGVKVIMTTALDDPKTVVESYYKLGATSYIVKPIGKQKLLQELEKLAVCRYKLCT